MLTGIMKWLWNSVWEYTKGIILTEILTLFRISLPPLVISVLIWI